LNYSLTDSDHIWVLNYNKSTQSALENPHVLALLANYLPSNFSIKRTKTGRPFAQSTRGIVPDFSIAHSHNLLVIALSQNNIGIDIEYIKPRSHIQKISKRYFSNSEPRSNLVDFYYSWTAREAYIKAKAQHLFKLNNINIISNSKIWHIGENNILDYQVKFKFWEEKKYLIAICRPKNYRKKICYFSLREQP